LKFNMSDMKSHQTGETARFKIFKEEQMDKVSPSFCGAKWFEGTIWLYQGATASCHHNPFHKIELDPNDPSSLQNTPQKIRERQAMLDGEKPSGCNYCWSIEDDGGLSDRYIKTQAVPTYRLYKWMKAERPLTTNPYMLEIAFDRICNLACAYCGPAFSTKWANDIKNYGPYEGLLTDSRYTKSNDEDMIDQGENPYVEAFFKWLPTLERDLKWLRVTGGEPTMSPNFWRFLDRLKEGEFNRDLSINTNLVCKEDVLQRLLDTVGSNFRTVLHTSIESSLKQTEYIRDGFDGDVWMKNVITVLESPSYVVNRLNFTTSINNLGVWSMIDYLNMIKDLKIKYGQLRVELNCNFVHSPAFMRVQLIPIELRLEMVKEFTAWLDENRSLCHDTEIAHVERLIVNMSETNVKWEKHLSEENALKDLKSYVSQYDKRRNKNFRESLDQRFINWYDSI